MRCPSCGTRPLRFTRFLTTLNPFRIVCVTCGARLRAMPVAYLWTLLHVPLGWGIVQTAGLLEDAGRLESPLSFAGYLFAAAGLLFVTAYVIPWFWPGRSYRVAL